MLLWDLGSLYISYVEKYPIVTKAITASIIQALGDTLSQRIEISVSSSPAYNKNHKKCNSDENAAEKDVESKSSKIDFRRVVALASEGLFVSGPLMHFAYDFFDSILPIHNSTSSRYDYCLSWLYAVLQIIADLFIMDSFFVLSALIVSGVVEGQYFFQQIIPQIKSDYLSNLKAAWYSSLFIFPLQLLSFRYLPLYLRVLIQNLLDVIWNGVISYLTHVPRRQHSESVHHQSRNQTTIVSNVDVFHEYDGSKKTN